MTPRLLAALTALLLFTPAVRAQGGPPGGGPPGGDPVARITQGAGLTAAQVAQVRAAFRGGPPQGGLWPLAARLAPTLSAAQLTALTRSPQGAQAPRGGGAGARGGQAERGGQAPRGGAGAQGQGERPAPPQGAGRGGEARPGPGRPDPAAERTARAEALGLTAQQRTRLDRAAPGGPPTGAAGAVPAAVAGVLTPAQERVWRVHDALARRLGPPPGAPPPAR